jgi:hypothetical protein
VVEKLSGTKIGGRRSALNFSTEKFFYRHVLSFLSRHERRWLHPDWEQESCRRAFAALPRRWASVLEA